MRIVTRLLCVGDLSLDVTITFGDQLAYGSDTSGAIAIHGGGSAANVAAWATRAGAQTRFVGAVGDDRAADFLVEDLRDAGVKVRAIRRARARSGAIAALIGTDGERSLISDHETSVAPTVDDYDPGWFDGIEWLHLTAYTYITERSRELFRHLCAEAAARSVPRSVDPSAAHLLRTTCDLEDVRDAFCGATALFPSRDEAAYLSGLDDPSDAASELLEIADTVAVTCGPDGAHVASRGDAPFHVAARQTDVVNTLGAGDAFVGGFLAARLGGLDVRTAAGRAVEVAARALQLPSAR